MAYPLSDYDYDHATGWVTLEPVDPHERERCERCHTWIGWDAPERPSSAFQVEEHPDGLWFCGPYCAREYTNALTQPLELVEWAMWLSPNGRKTDYPTAAGYRLDDLVELLLERAIQRLRGKR